MVVIRLFSVFLLGFAFLLPLSLSALAQPRTDFYGPGDSGAAYDFYLDWMYPKRDYGPAPTPAETEPVTVEVGPRTDFDGPGDSGTGYDFYLEWMSPRVKPKTPRVIQFLTRKASQVEEQALSSSQ